MAYGTNKAFIYNAQCYVKHSVPSVKTWSIAQIVFNVWVKLTCE